MRLTVLIIALILQAGSPALATEGCPNVCPEGMVWSNESGKCEPYKPLMV